jgi:phage-related protein
MSSVSSISATAPAQYVRSAGGVAPAEGDYENNARMFGPLAASAIGAAEAGGTAASSVVSFSSESLQKLGDAIESGYDTVKSGIESVVNGVSTLASEGAATVENAYDEVADAVSSVAGGIGDAATSVSDTVSSALGTVGQYAMLGVAAGKQLLSEVA